MRITRLDNEKQEAKLFIARERIPCIKRRIASRKVRKSHGVSQLRRGMQRSAARGGRNKHYANRPSSEPQLFRIRKRDCLLSSTSFADVPPSLQICATRHDFIILETRVRGCSETIGRCDSTRKFCFVTFYRKTKDPERERERQ